MQQNFSTFVILISLLVFANGLFAQSGDLDIMNSYVEGKRTYSEKVDFSFEIKNMILTIYDNSGGEKKVWRYYMLLEVNEDDEDIKSYTTENATIRIYFPEINKEGSYKGNLELNIVSFEYMWDWWKFSKKY